VSFPSISAIFVSVTSTFSPHHLKIFFYFFLKKKRKEKKTLREGVATVSFLASSMAMGLKVALTSMACSLILL
jgi:hypothetical protein